MNTWTASVRESLMSREHRRAMLPPDTNKVAASDLERAMNSILADVIALYRKTTSFYWHMRGPRAHEHHLVLDEQTEQLYAMTDEMVEHIRNMGGEMLRSIGLIIGMRRHIVDEDAGAYIEPSDMLAELREDNKLLGARLRDALDACNDHGDIEIAQWIEIWIHKTECRNYQLIEA
ncbi:MAG TPA: ferritin-like domain-containing protein [Steroidobacteraceae bacterium]|nr:ferritin-like domain-containing protein [Steroidobacteraceae bacterium]